MNEITLHHPLNLSTFLLLSILVTAACQTDPGEPRTEVAADETHAPSTAPAGIEPLQAPSFSEAVEEGEAEIRVLFVASTGFAGRDESGELTGVTVEILREFGRWVEETRGIDVSVRFEEEGHWPTFYQRVRYSEGGVFGIGNVTITEARRDELAFSPPYLDNVAILMTHEDVPELESLEGIAETFADLTGLLYTGTLHEERVEALREQYFPAMRTATVGSNDGLVSRVASGDGYFGYIDVYNYWAAVERGEPLRHHPVGDDASEQFGVIMPLDSDWIPVMDEFFQRDGGLMESEWYRDLLERHLGGELARLLMGG
jgi:ABC-type amino acid transport substrate-binding protein